MLDAGKKPGGIRLGFRLAQGVQGLSGEPLHLQPAGGGLVGIIIFLALANDKGGQKCRQRKAGDGQKPRPREQRRLQVKRLTIQTLRTLRQPETQADATRFFSGIQQILRAHIGLTLNQPAEGITAQTLAEADMELPDAPREALDRLMSQDDLTRFANDDGPIDPPAALRDLDLVLRHLK